MQKERLCASSCEIRRMPSMLRIRRVCDELCPGMFNFDISNAIAVVRLSTAF